MRIDIFASHEKNGVRYGKGHSFPYGATHYGGGVVNFSVNSVHATSCTLVLFHKGADKPYVEIDIPDEYKIGDNYSVLVFGLNIEDVEYGYRFGGEYNPKKGLYFNRENILLDPYALLVSGREVWGKPKYADDNFPMRGCILQTDYEWEDDVPLCHPMEDTIIYEMHVRGFTKHESSGVKHKGTYNGIIEKIPHLKELGINCVELLPVFEFNELEFSKMQNMADFNYWGYSPVVFFAPKAGYASLGPRGMAADEFKNMVKKLHQNDIEVVLDVVFNHTAELNLKNNQVTYNYRGIDNPTYYIMNPDGTYADYAGCSNTMNCQHPIVRNMILDCLRYWVCEYHIDGFRFDLASILSRDTDGQPMVNPPLLESLAMDPTLSKTKLIAEAWDAGGLYQVGHFPAPKRWAEWNGCFRDCVRAFIRGEAYAGQQLINRMQGSPDIFSDKTASSVVNFVTCHDGFTMMDLVSYNEKHNLANKENNRDGSNDNISWNCGCEGETDDEAILTLRRKNIKNALAIMLLSRGTPMILSGDEFGNTQFGNNNVYCQDNEISWLNWADKEKHKDIFQFVSRMIALRKAHPVVRRSDYFKAHNSTGYPDMSFHGTRAWDIDVDQPSKTLAVMYAESAKDYAVKEDCFIYIGMNVYSEIQHMELPVLPEGFIWHKYVDTSDMIHDDTADIVNEYNLKPNTTVVLVAKKK